MCGGGSGWLNTENVDEASWLIGEESLIGKEYALRSLAEPGSAYTKHPVLGKDDQVSSMDDLYSGKLDNGGVHINSGIVSHAFYLFAKSVGGNSWEVPLSVFYKTLTVSGMVLRNTTFAEFAQSTIGTAHESHGSAVVEKLRSAWQAVKVL